MSFEKQYSYELTYNPYNFYYSTNRQDLPSKEVGDELKEETEMKHWIVILLFLLKNVINMNYVKTNI